MQGVIVLGEQPAVWENRAAFSTWIVDRVFDERMPLVGDRKARHLRRMSWSMSWRISLDARRALRRASP